jgi:CDP-6-deoxy-D-xylo-4-hexulose-3-dehydrase
VSAEASEAARLKREIAEKVAEYFRVVHAPQPFVPLRTRVHYAGRVFGEQEMVNLVDSALDFWLTLGPWGERFEHKLKQFLGVRDFVAVNSGSAANLTAILALMSPQWPEPLRPGDEVITPAVTFPTTLSPLVHSGLMPVFVDCEVGTYNINPQLIADAIGPRTRALMVPHTLANPCDMDVLGELVQRHRLYLVEDACDALGSKFRGRLVGTFGDLASFSFFPAHHITMGEGGGVAVRHPDLARIVRSVRDWGRDCWCAPGESNSCGRRFGWQLGELPPGYDHKYIYSNLGYNFKPTDLQAAIGVAQAARLPEFCRQRRENFQTLYRGLLKYEPFLLLPRLDPRSDPAWFGLPITVQNGVDRGRLVQFLEAANIETRQIFGGNILKQPAFRNLACRIHGTLEQTDRIMCDSFFIGVYPGLTPVMLEFVLQRFDEFFASRQNWA